MMNREQGYYWVKLSGKWVVGFLRQDCYWDVCVDIGNVSSEDYESDEFDEINETRILSPDENEGAPFKFADSKMILPEIGDAIIMNNKKYVIENRIGNEHFQLKEVK